MTNRLKVLFIMFLLMPAVFLFAACGGGEEEPGGDGASTTAPVTYSLEAYVSEQSQFNYSKETNTIALTYGEDFWIEEEFFVVNLIGSDGSKTKVYRSYEDTADNGYLVDMEPYYEANRAKGTYAITITYKTYSTTINLVVSEAVVPKPYLLSDSFEYDGNYIFITDQDKLQNYNSSLIEMSDDSTLYERNANSYKLTLKLKDKTSSVWADGTTDDIELNWEITKKAVNAPTVTQTTFNYIEADYPSSGATGENHVLNIDYSNTNISYFSVSGEYDGIIQTEAGEYTTRLVLNNPNYSVNGASYIDIEWEILPITLEAPTLAFTSLEYKHELNTETRRYEGVSQTNEVVYATSTQEFITIQEGSSNLTNINQGNYSVNLKTKNSNYLFSTNGAETLTLSWVITPMSVELPTLLTTALEYKDNFSGTSVEGVAQTIEFDYHGFEELFEITSGSEFATEVGEHNVKLSLIDRYNYQIIDLDNHEKTYTYNITPKKITSPTIEEANKYLTYKFNQIQDDMAEGGYCYQAINQKPVVSGITNYIKFLTELVNNGASVPNGETPYYATVKIKEDYKDSYVFSTTNSNEDLKLEYYINKIVIDVTNVHVMPAVGVLGYYISSPAYIGSNVYMAAWAPDDKLNAQFMADSRIGINYQIVGMDDFNYVGEIGEYKTIASLMYPAEFYKIGKYVNGALNIIDTDGVYDREHNWEIEKQTVDFKNIDWDYGNLLYTGEKIEVPHLAGEYNLTTGNEIFNLLTSSGYQAEFKEIYTLYKYDETSETYKAFEGELKDKGKYKIEVELVYQYRHVGTGATGEIRTINYLEDEHFTIKNLPHLTTYFEVGKEGIDVKNMKWENIDTLEYNNVPLAPALTNVSDKVTYTYTYYNEAGSEIDMPTNAGKYKVKATLNYDSDSYQLLNLFTPLEVEFEIKKVLVDGLYIELKEDAFVYDGTEKTVELKEFLLPSSVKIDEKLGVWSATKAGTYEVTIILTSLDAVNFEVVSPFTIRWTIEKQEIDAAGIAWSAGENFVYDAEDKEFEVENLPANLTVSNIKYYVFDGENWVQAESTANAGSYKAEFTLNYDEENYELINLSLQPKEFNISRYEIDLSSVSWSYTEGAAEFIYNGEAKQEPTITNEFKFASISYIYMSEDGSELEKGSIINAGTYYARLVLSAYDEANVLVSGECEDLEWKIEKGTIDLSGIAWPTDWEYDYDGNLHEHKLVITTLPEEITSINYRYTDTYDEECVPIDADMYYAYVEFIYDEDNYNVINAPEEKTMFRINEMYLFNYNFIWDYNSDEPYVYDGKPHLPQITNLPEGAYASYSISGKVEVGSYSVEAYISGDNYIYTRKTQWFKIVKADVDLSNVKFSPSTFVYDGTAKSVTLEGVDETIFRLSLYSSDSNLSATDAGTYSVEYEFILVDSTHYNDHFENIVLTWSITPKEANMAGAKWEGEEEFDFAEYGLNDFIPKLVGAQDEINFVYTDYKYNEETHEYIKLSQDHSWIAGRYKRVFSVQENTNYILSGYTEEEMSFEFTINKIDFDWDQIQLKIEEVGKNGEILVIKEGFSMDSSYRDAYYVPICSILYGYYIKEWGFININTESEVGIGGDFGDVIYIKNEGDNYIQTQVGKYHTKLTFTIGKDDGLCYNNSSKVVEYDWYAIEEGSIPYGEVTIGDTVYQNYEFMLIDTIDISNHVMYSSLQNKKLKIKYNHPVPLYVYYHTVEGGSSYLSYYRQGDGCYHVDILGLPGVTHISFSLTTAMPDKYIKIISTPELQINGEVYHYNTDKEQPAALVDALTDDGDYKISLEFMLSETNIQPFEDRTYTDLFNDYTIWVASENGGEPLYVFTESASTYKSALSKLFVMFKHKNNNEQGYGTTYDFRFVINAR